jgi:Bardet-Biedl syndrome 9 protein
MSLFDCNEYWSYSSEYNEECSNKSLAISYNLLANDKNHQVFLATGSFQGYLRIFQPSAGGYNIEQLILENNLDAPILQLEIGRFTNNSNIDCMAVLQPKKLVVYNLIVSSEGSTMIYSLAKQYEHRFDASFSAYNMCYGSFGSCRGDSICVQSLAGCLAIYQQELLAFKRFLPQSLLPGPICYVAKIDSFITSNSSMNIQAIKYQAFSNNNYNLNSGNGSNDNSSDNSDDSKRAGDEASLQVDWSLNMGETVIELFVARYSRSLAASQVDILVLTEKSLFTLKESGAIRLQKRLDYNPSTAYSYTLSSEEDVGGSNQNLIIATQQSSLMVYRDTQLIWAARTSNIGIPVAVKVVTINNTKGLLVLMNERGAVSICYLGTTPPANSVTNTNQTKELNYEAMDEEHKKLLKLIKQANTDTLQEPKDKLVMKVHPSNALIAAENLSEEDFIQPQANSIHSESNEAIELVRDASNNILAIRLTIELNYTGAGSINHTTLAIHCCQSFQIKQRNLALHTINGTQSVEVMIALRKGILLSSTTAQLIASFSTDNSEPRTSRLDFVLPLILAMQPIPPIKSAQFMLTLDTNKPPPNSLALLWPEYFDSSYAQKLPQEILRTNNTVLSVIYLSNGVECTCLLSKKSGRYRVQSNSFEGLSALTQLLYTRLQQYYKGKDEVGTGGSSVQISFTESIPLSEYFLLIDKHFKVQQEEQQLRAQLDNLSQQYRSIEKRLLHRYKDKTPQPLNSLDLLLNQTHSEIQRQASSIINNKINLSKASNQLQAATQLLVLLISAANQLDEENRAALTALFIPSMSHTFNQSWEDRLEVSLSYSLKTALSKTSNNDSSAAAGFSISGYDNLTDTTKLKRHIQLVLDRLSKGLRLVNPSNSNKQSKQAQSS